MAAFVIPEDEEVPWIRVLVRNAPWLEDASSPSSARDQAEAPVGED